MPKNTDFIDHCLMLHHRNTIFMIIYLSPFMFLHINIYLCTHYHKHVIKTNIHAITNIIINAKHKLQ